MHVSVMPQEVLSLLNVKSGSVIVDGTLGMGGHSTLIAEQLGSSGHLIGIDRDPLSLTEAKRCLKRFSLRIDLLNGSFAQVSRLLAEVNVTQVNGVLLDLGISSFQLDDPVRGFSFLKDGPLDMRMDQSQGVSAQELVNSLAEEELARIIFDYGEDRFARRIAKSIVWHRSQERIKTTHELARVVVKALPAGLARSRIHPATRTFQALRIEVNKELEVLQEALKSWFDVLAPGGRLCVISFHSLEDRIVKNSFKSFAAQKQGLILTKKPIEPTHQESQSNSRARSAKLRCIERVL